MKLGIDIDEVWTNDHRDLFMLRVNEMILDTSDDLDDAIDKQTMDQFVSSVSCSVQECLNKTINASRSTRIGTDTEFNTIKKLIDEYKAAFAEAERQKDRQAREAILDRMHEIDLALCDKGYGRIITTGCGFVAAPLDAMVWAE